MRKSQSAVVWIQEGNLQRYFNDISRYRPLASEEEAELAAKIRDGDEEALERLVKANLRFVVSVARNYENQGLPLSDLINEGNIGLVRAARRFDGSKNFRFISYAVWWVRQAILSSLAQSSRIVKLPLNTVGRIYRVGRTSDRLEQQLNRRPNEEEVSQEMGISRNDVTTAIAAGRNHTSLDAPVAVHSATPLRDMLRTDEETSPDERAFRSVLKTEVASVLEDSLSERERCVVSRYFGLEDGAPGTLEEISVQMNLTRERVRQIKESALKKLKKSLKTHPFHAYLRN